MQDTEQPVSTIIVMGLPAALRAMPWRTTKSGDGISVVGFTEMNLYGRTQNPMEYGLVL